MEVAEEERSEVETLEVAEEDCPEAVTLAMAVVGQHTAQRTQCHTELRL